jgi:AcrR family transcriptional regulator
MRADAQQNHDRLLEAAAQAFARDGADASLKDIAQAAGVGIGTLYRRFPTREVLVEATYRSETARIAEAAEQLAVDHPPVEALRLWMSQFVDYIETKHGMAESLQAVLSAEHKMETRQLLADAIAELLRAGIQDGVLRPGIAPMDVLMALGGVTLIATSNEPGLAGRLLDLLVDGLRYGA